MMKEIFAALFVFFFLTVMFVKVVTFYEYDTKSRLVQDELDRYAHKVKITGVMTSAEEDNLRGYLGGFADFSGAAIKLYKGNVSGGVVTSYVDYTAGTVLAKGDVFDIYVVSNDDSNFSRAIVFGTNDSRTDTLPYKATSSVRVELVQ